MRLPFVVYVLAVGTFLMLTTEFVVAGLLPEIAGDLQVSVAQAGLLITVFAVGMIVGAPTMALLTRRMPRRVTLMLALAVFAAGTSSSRSAPASRCCWGPGSSRPGRPGRSGRWWQPGPPGRLPVPAPVRRRTRAG